MDYFRDHTLIHSTLVLPLCVEKRWKPEARSIDPLDMHPGGVPINDIPPDAELAIAPANKADIKSLRKMLEHGGRGFCGGVLEIVGPGKVIIRVTGVT